MIINKIYDYPLLMKANFSNRRLYLTPSGNLPSVTTILSETRDNSRIDEWKKNIGEKKAEQEIKNALNLGSIMHVKIEKYIKNEKNLNNNKTNLIYQLANKMGDLILNEILKSNLSEVWGLEETIYYPGEYAGTIDCIGIFNGKPHIIDFKTSKKIKSQEEISDYFLQIAAYIKAHNNLLNTDIKNGVIIMVSRDIKYKLFFITEDNLNFYTREWEKRYYEWKNISQECYNR